MPCALSTYLHTSSSYENECGSTERCRASVAMCGARGLFNLNISPSAAFFFCWHWSWSWAAVAGPIPAHQIAAGHSPWVRVILTGMFETFFVCT